MTPLEAYTNCAEYYCAASYHSKKDGISVTYVLAWPNFFDALPTVERLAEITNEIREKVSSGESTMLLTDAPEIGAKKRSEDVAALCEERRKLTIELAETLDLPIEVMFGHRAAGE